MKYNFKKNFLIDNVKIGLGAPVFFISEIGSNFDGNIKRAKSLIKLSKKFGANAVKFQHYSASSLVSDPGFKSLGNSLSHQKKWKESVYDTYKKASLNPSWTKELAAYSKKQNIIFFTSPYSGDLVDAVDDYVPAYKIGSGDISNIELIKKIAKLGKPIMLATGASNFFEVKQAVEVINKYNNKLVLMQCNTNYTSDNSNYKNLNLKVLETYKKKFPGIVLGLSDHTFDEVSTLGAIALGVKVIEKHFTDVNTRSGPDHSFSLNTKTWPEMIKKARQLEQALGNGEKKIEKNEKDSYVIQRRSVCASRFIPKGKILKKEDLIFLRPLPSNAFHPYEIDKVLGKAVKKDIDKYHIITKKIIKD
jgi:N-acetylneuraminate synthase